MTQEAEQSNAIVPDAILAGIGGATREELCGLVALLESVHVLGIARASLEGAGRRIGVVTAAEGHAVEVHRADLMRSSLPEEVLRHRLWHGLMTAFALREPIPFSTSSARRAAAALAVRTAERLSPALATEMRTKKEKPAPQNVRQRLSARVVGQWEHARSRLGHEASFSFPEVVQHELLRMMSDDALIERAAAAADPEVARALRRGGRAASTALATGGSWAVFAGVVANAGFAPYLLAAQASSVIPFVAGPTLTSLLAVLVNPATLIVGIGAIGWLGMGRGAQVVRSQIASRLCILLAIKAHNDLDTGLPRFLADMRRCADHPRVAMGHLPHADHKALRARLAWVERRLKNAMADPAGPPPVVWQAPALPKQTRKGLTDAAIVTAFTAGEMVWHAAAISPEVLAAADFSRTADLGDPVSFAVHAYDLAAGGAYYGLRGYVAEQAVMARLVEQGHAVSLAPKSNTPGLDLEVDGMQVQVKCGENLSLLEKHFDRYPDIPVIANAELVELAVRKGAPWADLVTTVPGFEIATVEMQLDAALEAADDLAAPDIFGFALSTGLLRGGIEVWRGRIPAADLPAWLLVDGVVRGSLAVGGVHAGLWVGLVVIGPAGALILSPLSGAAAQMGAGRLRDGSTKLLLRDWQEALLTHGVSLHRAVAAAAVRRVEMLEQRRATVRIQKTGDPDLDAWLNRRAGDDVIAAIEDEIDMAEPPANEADVLMLLVNAARVAPADAAALRARHAVERHLRTRPTLRQAMMEAGQSTMSKIRRLR